MTRLRWALAPAVVLLLGAATGCGQGAAATAQQTCSESKTDAGLTVTLATTPCPAKGGQSTAAHITIKDTAGAAVTDAAVKVVPDMPSMGMQGSEQPATAAGDGYDSKLVLGMGGDWQVRVLVARGSASPASVQFVLTAN
jgi:hypothetical protein